MSVASTARVWAHSKATGNARLVLLAIADHDGEGGAWPSIATLARMCAITPRNVQKHVETLVALGEVVVHKRQGGTLATPAHMRPNRYEITLVENPPGPVDRLGDNPSSDPLSVATPPVGSDTPPPVGSDTPPPVGSDTRTTQGTTQGTTPPAPPAEPGIPESVTRLWGREGFTDDEQTELWAMLLADPETLIPARRARQGAWYVTAIAQIRARHGKARGESIRAVRRYGADCDHGEPGGAELHPTTGRPFCPLCRAEAAS